MSFISIERCSGYFYPSPPTHTHTHWDLYLSLSFDPLPSIVFFSTAAGNLLFSQAPTSPSPCPCSGQQMTSPLLKELGHPIFFPFQRAVTFLLLFSWFPATENSSTGPSALGTLTLSPIAPNSHVPHQFLCSPSHLHERHSTLAALQITGGALKKSTDILKTMEDRLLKRYDTDVHSHITHDSQKVEVTPLCLHGWMGTQNMLCAYDGIPCSLPQKGYSGICTVWGDIEVLML